MKIIILGLVAVTLTSCASVKMSEGALKVRIVKNTPSECTYVSEISGSDKGESVTGGMLWTHDYNMALTDLKNMAATRGINAIEVTDSASDGSWVRGEGYNCTRQPASK